MIKDFSVSQIKGVGTQFKICLAELALNFLEDMVLISSTYFSCLTVDLNDRLSLSFSVFTRIPVNEAEFGG